MANEAQLSVTVNVQKRDATTGISQINFTNNYTNLISVAGASGPYGGTVLATTAGTFVSLGSVGVPGIAVFTNQDLTNKAYVGVYDNSTGRFIPFLRLDPGVTLAIVLPESFREWSGTVPGTGSLASDQLMIKSTGGSVNVLVQVFPE